MLVGMGSPVVNLPLGAAATREVDVLGCFRYANTYKEALQLLADSAEYHQSSQANALNSLSLSDESTPSKTTKQQRTPTGILPDVSCLITHRFPLEESARAFDLLAKGKDEQGRMVLKVMIGPSSDS